MNSTQQSTIVGVTNIIEFIICKMMLIYVLIAMPKRLSSKLTLVRMLLTRDWSIDDMTLPKKYSIVRPLGASAATLPAICSID